MIMPVSTLMIGTVAANASGPKAHHDLPIEIQRTITRRRLVQGRAYWLEGRLAFTPAPSRLAPSDSLSAISERYR